MPTSTPRKKAAPSGNPANRAPSAVSAFKNKSAGQPIELPSGLVAVVRRLGLTTLLAENLLGDELGVLAQEAVSKGKGKPADSLRDEVANDPEKVGVMLDAFDRVTARAWINPPVVFYKVDDKVIPEGDRDPEVLYSDELDLPDKIFTFNWVNGGSSDLARFRREFSQLMEGLSAGEGVGE